MTVAQIDALTREDRDRLLTAGRFTSLPRVTIERNRLDGPSTSYGYLGRTLSGKMVRLVSLAERPDGVIVYGGSVFTVTPERVIYA
jgi:hypothetical protein